MKDIVVLGIETSCDETSAAIVKNGREVLSNIINSQIEIHKKYGGVVPEIASRKHVDVISYVVHEALENANMTFSDIDVISCTYGPRFGWCFTCRNELCQGFKLCFRKTSCTEQII